MTCLDNFELNFKDVLSSCDTLGYDVTIVQLKKNIQKAKAINHSILILSLINKIDEEFKLNPSLEEYSFEICPRIDDFLDIKADIKVYSLNNGQKKFLESEMISNDCSKFANVVINLFNDTMNSIVEFSYLGSIVDSDTIELNKSDGYDSILKSLLSKSIYIATKRHLLDLNLSTNKEVERSDFIKV